MPFRLTVVYCMHTRKESDHDCGQKAVRKRYEPGIEAELRSSFGLFSANTWFQKRKEHGKVYDREKKTGRN